MDREKFVKELVNSWAAPHVARTETMRFSGGALSPRTVANIESKDPANKVPGRFMVGRKIMYPTRAFAEWLGERLLKEA